MKNNEREKTRVYITVYKDTWDEFNKTAKERKQSSRGGSVIEALDEAFFYYLKFNNETVKLDDVFTYRRNPAEIPHISTAYEDIYDSKEVFLCGISLKDFFLPTGQYSRLILNTIKKHDTKIYVLILNPLSTAAFERMAIEEDFKNLPNPEFSLFTDITTVISTLKNKTGYFLNDEDKKKWDKKIIPIFMDEMPLHYLVITENFTFMESYHNGSIKDIKELYTRDLETYIKCIGGYVPYFKFNNNSIAAELYKNHFLRTYRKYEMHEKGKHDLQWMIDQYQNPDNFQSEVFNKALSDALYKIL